MSESAAATSPGEIAGIVIGIVAGVVLGAIAVAGVGIAAVSYFSGRHQKYNMYV